MIQNNCTLILGTFIEQANIRKISRVFKAVHVLLLVNGEQ